MRPVAFFLFRGGLCAALMSLLLAGCGSKAASDKPPQAEVDAFTKADIPPEWKGWKPGMPKPTKPGVRAPSQK